MSMLDDPTPPQFLRPEPIDIYNLSLDRCQADPTFLGQFYDRFVDADENVAVVFEGIDFDRQRRKLRASLYMVPLVVSGDQFAGNYLQQIAKSHGKSGMNLDPALYTVFVDRLLETVAAVDPEFSDEVGAAWQAVLGAAVEFMLAHSG